MAKVTDTAENKAPEKNQNPPAADTPPPAANPPPAKTEDGALKAETKAPPAKKSARDVDAVDYPAPGCISCMSTNTVVLKTVDAQPATKTKLAVPAYQVRECRECGVKFKFTPPAKK